MGDAAVEEGEPRRLPRIPRSDHAADRPAHLRTDPLAVRVVAVPALGRIDAETEIFERHLLRRPAEGDERQPLFGDVRRRQMPSLLLRRLKKGELVGDIVVHGVGRARITVDLPEHRSDVLRRIALDGRAERACTDLRLPPQMRPAEEVLALRVIGIHGQRCRTLDRLEAVVHGIAVIGMPLRPGRDGEEMEHPAREERQPCLIAPLQGLHALFDEHLRRRDVIAHVLHVLHGSHDDVLLRPRTGHIALPLHLVEMTFHSVISFTDRPALLLFAEHHGTGGLHGFKFQLPCLFHCCPPRIG